MTNRMPIIIGVAVVAIAALALRFVPASMPPRQSNTTAGPIVATSSVPEFTSAKFFDGDLLHDVGPDWTFIAQTNLAHSTDYNPFDGTTPLQGAIIKLIGKNTELGLTEYSIMDAKTLEKKLGSYTPSKVAGRDGYIVSAGDITGSTGFAIVGTNAVLFIQYGDARYGNYSAWPSQLEPEAQSFIASVQVP